MTLSLLPTVEVVEAVVHLVDHGDLAHNSQADHGNQLGTDEHGCTGTFHLCGCHTASVIEPAGREDVRGMWLTDEEGSFSLVEQAGLGATAPPIRPPIS